MDFLDHDCFVGMAWAHIEQDTPEAVLEGCLIVANETHEACRDELEAAITEMGQSVDEYAIVIRRVK